MLKQDVNDLPELPGVYRYLDEKNVILYIGKARNLKKRVSSYFIASHLSPRIQLMIRQVVKIEITVTRSEKEALILEHNLIKSAAPKYNILFRDDKSYPYLKFTEDDYPRIEIYRGKIQKNAQYWGPFPNGSAVRESLVLLQRIFRLRTCEDSIFKHRSRPCLLFQIQQCSAPCVNLIDQATYQADVQQAKNFLAGRTQTVLTVLEQKMLAYAATFEFEKAAVVRDQMNALSQLLLPQTVEIHSVCNVDVIGVLVERGIVCITIAMVRGGRHLGDRTYFPEGENIETAVNDLLEEGLEMASAVLAIFVAQHYAQSPPPEQLVLSHPLPELYESVLKAQYRVHCVVQVQGIRRQWLEQTLVNAKTALQAKWTQQKGIEDRIYALCEALGVGYDFSQINELWIECFDVSHSAGEATYGACVVFNQLAMQPKRYRRYAIEDQISGDDCAAMTNMLYRHYASYAERCKKGEMSRLPDIVLIDGGLMQWRAAQNVLSELGLNQSLLVGVAKGEHRKVGLETLWLGEDHFPLRLGAQHLGLMLIAKIRDEAHRFALTGMRAKRALTRQYSSLQDIPKIGAKRRQTLLTRFGGVQGVEKASVEELASVEGISLTLAQHIYQYLHG